MERSREFMQSPTGSKEALGADASFHAADIEDQGGDPTPETVDELRERLRRMKEMMAERGYSNSSRFNGRKEPYVINDSFLSYIFSFTLFLIVFVSGYAFYNLFSAVWRRNALYHEEL